MPLNKYLNDQFLELRTELAEKYIRECEKRLDKLEFPIKGKKDKVLCFACEKRHTRERIFEHRRTKRHNNKMSSLIEQVILGEIE